MQRKAPVVRKHIHAWCPAKAPPTPSSSWLAYYATHGAVPPPEPIRAYRRCAECHLVQSALAAAVAAEDIPKSLEHLADVAWT